MAAVAPGPAGPGGDRIGFVVGVFLGAFVVRLTRAPAGHSAWNELNDIANLFAVSRLRMKFQGDEGVLGEHAGG